MTEPNIQQQNTTIHKMVNFWVGRKRWADGHRESMTKRATKFSTWPVTT